jgi:parallel beta-helix repeat protein
MSPTINPPVRGLNEGVFNLGFDVRSIPGAIQAGLEVSRRDIPFSNPRGRDHDPNGSLGGRIFSFSEPHGLFQGITPHEVFPKWGTYQIRVIGLDSQGEPVGRFSRASEFRVARNVIYVDDDNEGGVENGETLETAWGSISEALNDPRWREVPGNLILVKGGVYKEQLDLTSVMSGKSDAPNELRAFEGEEVILDGGRGLKDARVECILLHTDTAFIKINGFILRNSSHRGILAFGASHCMISNNKIYNSGDAGIELWYGSKNNIIINNLIYSNNGAGITISGGADKARRKPNLNNIFKGNIIHSNTENGVFIKGDLPHTFSLYNNVIYANGKNGIFVKNGIGWGDIRGNIVLNNDDIGLKDFAGSTTFNDYNTLFANGDSGNNNYDEGDSKDAKGSHTIIADPLFFNRTNFDFRLKAASPCIDAGPQDSWFDDLDGSRNDMGAYGGPPFIDVAFNDDFAIDTTENYSFFSNNGSNYEYDASEEKLRIVTGEDSYMQITRDLTPSHSGRFSLDFIPTQAYLPHGNFFLRLIQDSENYFLIHLTGDNQGSGNNGKGYMRKIRLDTVVEEVELNRFYASSVDGTILYHLEVDFTPQETHIRALGKTKKITKGSKPITVKKAEITFKEQDGFLDNMSYILVP